MWTLPELTECLLEAGFAEAQVWRHTAHVEKGEIKVFLGPVASLPEQASWVAYVVGIC